MEEIFLKREVFYLSLEGKVSITGRRGGRPSQAEGTAPEGHLGPEGACGILRAGRRSQWLEYPRQSEDWQELAGTKPGRVLLAVLFTS